MIAIFIFLAILPEGTVVNETVFLTYLSILFGLIIVAVFLRKRNSKVKDDQ
jgi:hypothetical protein